MKMICPLFSSSHKWKLCLKEQCPWWNEAYSCCQLVELVRSISQIEHHLKEFKEKIPHVEQFVK